MNVLAATRSETTKQFTTAMWWVLALVLVGYVGFTASSLGFAVGASAAGVLGDDAPVFPEDGLAELLYSTATSVGYVFPLLIGTLMVTSEFRHKTLTPTFLAVPARGRALWAKVFVGILLGVLYGAVGLIASVGPSAGILVGFGLETKLDDSDTWALLGRMLLAYVLWVLVGVGVGALVRNQVGAIVGVLVFTQFLEPVARFAAPFVDGLENVTKFLPGAAGDALVGASLFTIGADASTAETLEWWAGGAVLLGYAAVLLLLGYVTTWRRDVS